MEFKFTYLPEFHKNLSRLSRNQQKLILKKIKEIQQIQDLSVFKYIKPLALKIEKATHKLRVGDYRIFFRIAGNEFEAQNIVSRKDAYK